MAAKIQKTSEADQIKMHDKANLISSERYKNRKDLLAVVLTENKQYSFEDVDKIINDFMRKEAK